MALHIQSAKEFETLGLAIQDMKAIPGNAPLNGSKKGLGGTRVEIGDTIFDTSERFWVSLLARYGLSSNVFNYFEHQEVFDRIATVRDKDQMLRIVTERPTDQGDSRTRPRLLSITNPGKPYVNYYNLKEMLLGESVSEARYAEGIVFSHHDLPSGGSEQVFSISGEKYTPRMCLKTPIDGYGKPTVYLEMVRQVCSNGMIGYGKAFKSEMNIGKSNDANIIGNLRMRLRSFSNDEGFAAFASRIDAATKSPASVHEVMALREHLHRIFPSEAMMGIEIKGKKALEGKAMIGREVYTKLNGLTGSLVEMYGLTQNNALSRRKARTIPTKARVADLINLATETATHKLHDAKEKFRIQGWLGELISNEYDLEGTGDKLTDFAETLLEGDHAK